MHSFEYLNSRLHNLRSFPVGAEVEIELSGIHLGDEKITPDVRLSGELEDPAKAFIRVERDTSEAQLGGRTVGLAMEALIQPHPLNPNKYPVIIQKTIAEGAFALYYAPEDIDPNYQGCAPKDKIERMMAYYAHVAVDGKLLF